MGPTERGAGWGVLAEGTSRARVLLGELAGKDAGRIAVTEACPGSRPSPVPGAACIPAEGLQVGWLPSLLREIVWQ